MQTNNPTPNTDRLNIVDALRGFALAGIVIAHMVEQYTAAPRPETGWGVESLLIDKIVVAAQVVFFIGKFYSIFALLFGMSFAIMMHNTAAKGGNFSGRFLWRLTLLLIFGIIHSLVYRGDILVVYVVIGFALPLFYNLPNKWLWAITALLFLGAGRFLFFAITGKASLLSSENTPSSPEVIAYVEVLKTASFWGVVKANFPYLYTGKFDFQFGIFGRGYFTLAYFLAGMYLIRCGIVHKLSMYKPIIKRVMFWSLGLTLIFYALAAVAFLQIDKENFSMNSWSFVMSYNIFDLTNLGSTVFFVCGFTLLYLRRPEGILARLAPYGRMALSNYLLQSLLGTFLLYGWGLGLLGNLHDWQTLLLGLAIIWIQIKISHLWMQKFHYGPCEWLWRCGTYFKAVKLRRIES